ncbi:FAD synthetase family protein [Paenibacillus hamazuiensis]|uniref:FAD synthetase family protein n=1 Tax=Paenibacillus hamazuiensis TaxID=2936508 RepID=UPI00200F61D8|nr:FAD synthetase family protein [Paenibacillus hamazuiensis]
MHVHAARSLRLPGSVLTIGAFDGVHKAHRELIATARSRADECGVPLVVYTFDPPPKVFFQHTLMLTSREEKLSRLKALGVDHAIVAPFNADYVSRGSAVFIEELEMLNPVEIWEGSDFRFGRDRDGGIDTLREKFAVCILDPVVCQAGCVISSSRIRALIENKQWSEAEHLLGWPVSGK